MRSLAATLAHGLILASATSLSLSTQAACNATPAAGDWQCLEAYNTNTSTYDDITNTGWNGPYTFEGPSTLQHWYVGSLNCNLSAQASVSMDTSNGEVEVEVSALSSSGSGSCGLVTFGGLPLEAYDSDSGTVGIEDDDDVHPIVSGVSTAYLDNAAGTGLTVYYDSTYVCQDLIHVDFGNSTTGNSTSDPSYFSYDDAISGWLGDCTIQGVLTSDGYTDINAW